MEIICYDYEVSIPYKRGTNGAQYRNLPHGVRVSIPYKRGTNCIGLKVENQTKVVSIPYKRGTNKVVLISIISVSLFQSPISGAQTV